MLPGFFRAPQVAVLITGLLFAASLAARGRRTWLAYVLACGLLAALLWHAIALSMYWQILPAYAASVLLLLAFSGHIARRHLAIATSALLLLAATGSLIVLPIFQLPEPTGAYAVGTTILHVVDPSRADETFASGHRELIVQVWYPASPSSRSIAMYRRWRETTLLSSYDAVLRTHSRLDAPPARAPQPFPLLLFNPAWKGSRTQNTFQMEELASHGFIVAAIDHTHNSMPIAFPDGKRLMASEPRDVDDFSGMEMKAVLAFADAEIEREAGDDLLLLNLFAGWKDDRNSRWYGLVDPEHAGAFGHSFGGAVAIAACRQDQRIRAALNMDGWMFDSLGSEGLGKPLFVMSDGDWPFDQQAVERESRAASIGERLDILDLVRMTRSFHTAGGYLLAIGKTAHMNFSDRALYSPFHSLTDTGPRDPASVHRIINAYTLAFFSKILRGSAEPLLNGSMPFTDTHMRAVQR